MSSRIVIRYRTIVVISGIIIFVFYVISFFPFLWDYSQPPCQFSDKLSVFAAYGLQPDITRIAASQLQPIPKSKVTVKGQATVFYVWCGSTQRPFEFRNYLSVRSAVRILRPDNVWFYYESEPQMDKKLYNTWWQELIDDVPFFHRRSLKDRSRVMGLASLRSTSSTRWCHLVVEHSSTSRRCSSLVLVTTESQWR